MARVEAGEINIGYTERGDAAGEALVFLHGVGSDKSAWEDQLDYFAPRFRVVALDYPGYGESDPAPGDLSRAEIASYLACALDKLKIEAAHIVGLSMGGVIALELWRARSERLLSLTLADTFARHPEGERILERSLRMAATLPMRELAEQRVGALLRPDAASALKRKIVESMARIEPRSYAWASRAVWLADYRADLPCVRTPTLIIVGEHDAVTPPELSHELHRGIPHAQLEIIPAGHLANIDNPSAFNRVLKNFLDSLAY